MSVINQGRRRVGEIVQLHVYDLSPANDALYHIGLGAYHSGVVVHGKEYTFGGDGGVFCHPPKEVPNATFREAVCLGETFLSSNDVQRIADDMREDWQGDSYDALSKNCNCFSEAFVQKLLNTGVPGYVNRMAYIGSAFSCLIPSDMRQNAPVNDGNNTTNGNTGFTVIAPTGAHRRAHIAAASKGTIPNGGRTLNENDKSTENSGWLGGFMGSGASSSTVSTSRPSDRREAMLQAALRRQQAT